jgi:hypothetical protein
MLLSRPVWLPVALALIPLMAGVACGQGEPVRLKGLEPGGARTTLTDTWGLLQAEVVNPGPTGRDMRVMVLFPDQPGVQYGRDVWVPARAAVKTWVPVRPAAAAGRTEAAEIQALLYDRTDGQNHLLLPPGDGGKIRSRLVRFRPRVPTTALLIDEPGPMVPGSPAGETAAFVNQVRAAAALPEGLSVPPAEPLPPTPEAFAGVDHVVVAGNRLSADPAGRWALRQWVEQGGRLWVMLDRVDPEAIAPLLGDAVPFQVVDRIVLTSVKLYRGGTEPGGAGRPFDRPVDLVRVIPADTDRVIVSVNGWPAAFARTVGRGRIMFTTLGAEAWKPDPALSAPAPAAKKDIRLLADRRLGSASGSEAAAVAELATELHPRGQPDPLPIDDLRPLVTEQIGYTVVGRNTAAAILGAFLLAVLALGVALRRSRRPERIGWLAAATAVGAAGFFVLLAVASRRAVPPTAATVAVAEVSPATGEAAVRGLFAVYQPESGPVPLVASHGELLDLDAEGLEGQTRRRIQTDTDAWHLEDLSLPAGVRTGRFQTHTRSGRVSAVGRFGPEGLEGRLAAGPFGYPADGLVYTPTRAPLAIRFGPDRAFAAGSADALPAETFLAGAVLSDRQQRRQAVYRQLLSGPLPAHLEGENLLFAWTEPDAAPFASRPEARVVGTVLLVVPLTLERTAPGTRVTIPPAFVAVRRADEARGQPTLESSYPAEMVLRFQVPESVRPLAVERATLHLHVRAAGRRVSVAGLADGRPIPVWEAESPSAPVRVEVTDGPLLRTDDQGGLHLKLTITNAGTSPPETPWRIESLGLEVVGRVAE